MLDSKQDVPRILFIFRGSGDLFRGIGQCSAFWETTDGNNPVSLTNPLLVTYAEPDESLHSRFATWLELSVADGLQQWRATLA